VEYLVSNPEWVSRKERIDALELLGATFVDKKRDMLGCFKLWKKAMEERYVNGKLVVPKQVLPSPISAYENTVEVQNLEQLQDIVSDPDQMRMQALLVRERILGPAHPDTSYYIRYRGAVYADMGHFERCITLWMYALDMQQQMLEPLSPMTQSSLLSFAELFSFMMSESRHRSLQQQQQQDHNNHPPNSPNHRRDGVHNDDEMNNNAMQVDNADEANSSANQHHRNQNSQPLPVNFCDIMTVFNRAVQEVKMGQKVIQSNASRKPGSSLNDRDLMYFNRTLIIALHLICLLTKLTEFLNAEQVFKVKKAVFDFLKLDARGRNGVTPLHLACSRESSSVGRYPICSFPNVDAINLLLECGADPMAVDNDGSSALHIAAASNRPMKSAVAGALLNGGAHFDAANKDGKAFLDLINKREGAQMNESHYQVINPLKHTTLQCLAARVLKRSRSTDRERFYPTGIAIHLPDHIRSFIELH
jgi:hypothetical protein